jgi:glutathione peroxidase
MMYKLLILAAVVFQISIYGIHFNDSSGTDTTLNAYAGKKILLVNIASGSSRVQQLAGLQQLYAQYHDSLAIVAFPSNSFGHEPLSDSAIRQLCQNTYGVGFTIAAKADVKDAGMQGIYAWLNSATQNGVANWHPVGDFHKFLIDKDGTLIGSFAPSMLPTDSTIINAITANLQ